MSRIFTSISISEEKLAQFVATIENHTEATLINKLNKTIQTHDKLKMTGIL